MTYTLPQLLSDTVMRLPEKEAVVSNEGTLSYRQLDEYSNKLARSLVKNHVCPGDRVGIYLNKSAASLVAVFGILKAAAVYVPLDPMAPPKRLNSLLRNCQIRCLLSDSNSWNRLQHGLLESPLRSVILTDNDPVPSNCSSRASVTTWAEVLVESRNAPTVSGRTTDLAYVLYTSGSTGEPKGVMISHLNSLAFINWARQTTRVRADDRVANHAPLHFDLSIFDIFVTVQAGATLYLVPPDIARFPVALAEFVTRKMISVWYSVPSVWIHLLHRGQMDRSDWSALRMIIFAGEVFPTKYLRQLMTRVPHAEYFNWYGPTETNVITCYHVQQLAPDQAQPVPIGRACCGAEVFALDDDGHQVIAPGTVGELYACGPSVALGYWDDPILTGSRFVRNPVQASSVHRAYRTGDLVMLDSQGNYLFLGRRDQQVKVQGHRVELGEIEAALVQHPDVVQAVVIDEQKLEHGTCLRAFVVPRDDRVPSVPDLRRFCGKLLPRYMIPEVIEVRTSLPSTSTGKVARSLLAVRD